MRSPKIKMNSEALAGEQVEGVVIVPRLLRFRDAPKYLGMDKNRFNREVRPWVTAIPIGRQGIAFDRLDLDAWVDEYKRSNGRQPTEGHAALESAPRLPHPTLRSAGRPRTSLDVAFAKAVERATSVKQTRR
jgi:hypothetical protein